MVSNPVLLLFALATLIGTAVIVAAVVIVITSGGGLGPNDACRNELTGEVRPITRDVSYADSFQRAWNEIAAQVIAGQPEVTVHLSENEVSSRATEYLEARDAPIDDIVVCFYDGLAEGRGKVRLPVAAGLPLVGGLFETEARVIGTMDLSGEHPRLAITDFDAGDLPRFIERAARDDVEREINDRLADLTLLYNYGLSFAEGVATVTAAVPSPAP